MAAFQATGPAGHFKDLSEMVIQQLLTEAGTTDHDHELVAVEAQGAEAPADWAATFG